MRPIDIKSGTMDQKTKLNRSRSDLLLLEEFSTRDLDSSQTSVFALKKQQPTAIEKIDEEMTARDGRRTASFRCDISKGNEKFNSLINDEFQPPRHLSDITSVIKAIKIRPVEDVSVSLEGTMER